MWFLPRVAAVGLAGAFALPVQAQLITHRDLSYPMAKTIAEVAIDIGQETPKAPRQTYRCVLPPLPVY